MALRPDSTFHASPSMAMAASAESYAYTLLLSGDGARPDALAVIDVQRGSPSYGQIVHMLEMPHTGDEFHHFGWNACSSALSPLCAHPFAERRYLVIPGLRSSRIYIVDTKPHPTKAKIHKIIDAEEVLRKTNLSRTHTVHCGPEGIYIGTLGGMGEDGSETPPGIFLIDCESFEILGRWDKGPGAQRMYYDFWWNLPRDYMVASEWGLPPQFEDGLVLDHLLNNQYGHRLHFWELHTRRNIQTIDLGANHQMVLEVRPAHDPAKEYGFAGVVIDTETLEGSVWTWWRERGRFHAKKTIRIPAEPAPLDKLPRFLQGLGAVPPLLADLAVSIDDKYLYVSCWGTGEVRQYDVTDPLKPVLTSQLWLGGVARRTCHPNGRQFPGGPQMIELSLDGKRLYWTNSFYSKCDDQIYPEGMPGIQVMANVTKRGLEFAEDFWVAAPDGYRAHQIHLDGGDCSTDSFCYPSV